MAKEDSVGSIGQEYLKSWEQHDLEKMGLHLAPNIRFKEPLSEITGRDSFLAFAEKNVKFVKEVNIRSSFESRNEAAFIYDFGFVDPIGPVQTAAYLTFEHGKIRDIELFYDPRHLEKMMSAEGD